MKLFRLRVLVAIVAAASTCVAPTLAAGHATLKLVKRLWGVGEVQVIDAGKARTLVKFTRPVNVVGNEVSADGTRAFVWYRGDRPPQRIAIYDLTTDVRTADFAPGVGGYLHFSPSNTLILDWGCGTNCAGFAIYDARGNTLESDVVSGLYISPRHRFVLTGPSLFASAEEGISLYDAAGLRIYRRETPAGGAFLITDVRFHEGRDLVEIDISDLASSKQRIVLRIKGKDVEAKIRDVRSP